MSHRIVGDWGTSRLRLFRIENGLIVDRREGPGIGALDGPAEAVLRAAIAPWRADGEPTAIALCGMVGSRNGWHDIPYVGCPADISRWLAGAGRFLLDGIPTTILTGLSCTTREGAPDVMRGEETQIFGAIASDPALREGVHRVVLPGTHSKWADVEDGRITGFRTVFTGELFALLRDRSTLLRAARDVRPDPADERAGFDDGIARGQGGRLLAALFEARSAQLLRDRSPGWAAGFLSGLLIAREIGEMAPPRGARIAVIGDPALAARYARAFDAYGVDIERLDGDAAVLAGLSLLETPS